MASLAETTIYAFLDDTSLHRKVQGLRTYENANQGVCCMDDQMVNYFLTPCSLSDVRTTRLRPIGLTSLPADPTGMVGRPSGNMTLHFDGEKIGNVDLSGTTLTTAELQHLFNIIEYAAFTQSEDGTLPNAAAINATMAADTANFGGYATNSLSVSAAIVDTDDDVRTKVTLTETNISSYYGKMYVYNGTKVELTASNRDTYIGTTGYVISSARIEMYLNGITNPVTPVFRTWIEFDMSLSGGQLVCFHIQVDRAGFMANYPFCNITNIIYPCDPMILRDLGSVDNVADLLAQSSHYTSNTLITPVRDDDHSGVYSFMCEYINTVIGTGQASYNFYFGVMYKGVAPDSETARTAIKNDLLEKTGTTEDDWRDILPGLFASAAFMFVPLWHHYVNNANNSNVPSKVYNVANFTKIMKKIYPNYTDANFTAYLEVLPNAVSDVLILSIPSTENSALYRSVQKIHPTYMALANSDPNVNKQNADTIKFAEGLNNIMSELISFISNETNVRPEKARLYNGVYCVPFTVGGITFHIVTKQDYPTSAVKEWM